MKGRGFKNNNNNNNICLKSNIQTSSVDCAPRELTHACSRCVLDGTATTPPRFHDSRHMLYCF